MKLDQDVFVTSRSHIMKTAPPTGGHLHEDWALNVTSTHDPFHEDLTINVASRVFTNKCGWTTDKDRKTAPSPWQPFLTKFYESWAKNVTSRVLTCFHYIHIEKNALPTGGHVFSPIWTIFELVREINKTYVLTNFHDDWAKIVTPVFTMKTAPPTGDHVFQQTGTTFELNQHIIRTNILTYFELDRDLIGTKLLTKFHEDRTINVASKCLRTNVNGRTDDGQRPVTKAHLSNHVS
ncbi:hypothetical protein DPMN_083780 [Dreissena polymorpha]|uniref:Uncharacterized protein n=1 Tax=Dreissena polymorpha TaxID=45954 RepID=A0A9D3Y9K3_DREPO|nr:hypothetical protein DPMN_083780 [Dreissena polymorpha]